MTSCTPTLGKHNCYDKDSLDIVSNDRLPAAAQMPTILRRHEAAKSIIETTLIKSAGILSEFTENTLSQTSTYFSKILAPERFGFPSPSPLVIQNKEKPGSTHANANSNVPSNNVTARKRPDITKLPSSIVDILREDSNSSIPSIQKSKKYHYHSKKMALKQRDDSSKEKVHVPLTPSNENTAAPKIVLVSTPLTLRQDSRTKVSTSTFKTQEKSNNNNHSRFSKEFSKNQSCPPPLTPAIKNAVHFASVVKKPEKINIGVDRGVAFIIGSKTKSPYFNTFGDTGVDSTGDRETLSNRKWVVNVGNFLDDEISLALMGNNLTITGFRQPSLLYPEGQSVSESIALPTEIDVNNLRIYRAKDAKAFLVIQEKNK